MRIYIGNISLSANESDIRGILSDFGPLLDFQYPVDRDTGKPRGFALAMLSSREFGEGAILILNGAHLGGSE